MKQLGLFDDDEESELLIEEGATPMRVYCQDCGGEMQIGSWPFCPDHSAANPHRPFKPFYFEGTLIDSIQAASKIERESMKRYRNGEGQPYVFRAFHQDNSNRDRNTLESEGYRQKQRRAESQRGFEFKKGYHRGEE